MVGDLPQPAVRVTLSSRQEQNCPAKGREEQHTEQGGVAIERVHSVDGDRDEQADPKDQVEHDGGTDPLGGESERRGRTGNPVGSQQSISHGSAGGCPSWNNVAHRQ